MVGFLYERIQALRADRFHAGDLVVHSRSGRLGRVCELRVRWCEPMVRVNTDRASCEGEWWHVDDIALEVSLVALEPGIQVVLRSMRAERNCK